MPPPDRSARGTGPGAEKGSSPELVWFEATFRAHHADLCGYLYRFLGSAEAAEDVVQDLFVAMWSNLPAWQAREQSLRPALFVAARNRALDLLKSQRVRTQSSNRVRAAMEPAVRTTDELLLENELTARVQEAVESLPERCRLIFTLSREGGRTYAEIAELLGLSVKTVETQMRRALQVLRTRVHPHLMAGLSFLLLP